ncbi:MAG: RNA polymerase sigma factor [Polyangiales bacterium]
MDDALEASFAAFLDAAQRGDREGLQRMLADIQAVLVNAIHSVVRTRADASSREDLVQDVFQRLLESPPTRPTRGATPKATVIKWVTTAAKYRWIDRCRSASRRTFEPIDTATLLTTGTTPEDLFERASDAVVNRAAMRRIISKHYPLGISLFDAMMEHPDLLPVEYAERLSISRANVDTRKKRILRELAEHVSEIDPVRRLSGRE